MSKKNIWNICLAFLFGVIYIFFLSIGREFSLKDVIIVTIQMMTILILYELVRFKDEE